MKKGGVREVNSFISIAPGEWTRDSKKSGKSASSSISKSSNPKSSTAESVLSTKTSIQKNKADGREESKSLNRSQSITNRLKRNERGDNLLLNATKTNSKLPGSVGLTSSKTLRNSTVDKTKTISSLKTATNDAPKPSSVSRIGKGSSKISATASTSREIFVEPNLSETSKWKKIEKNDIEVIQKKEIQDDQYNYEDDFEDYESTFESYSGSDSNDSLHQDSDTAINDAENQKIIIEEEKKMDSGSYDLMYRRQIHHKERNQLDIIKEALLKENTSLQYNRDSKEKVNPTQQLSSPIIVQDPQTELLLNFNAKTLENFTSARIKQRNSKTARMIRIRGQKLLEMITLDTMDYILYEQSPVPYEVFMRSFARQNTKQAYTQTNEDDVSCEIQTEEITFKNKWTQYPVRISKEELKNYNLAQLLAGVGDENSDSVVVNDVFPEINSQKLDSFVRIYGEEMIAVLEENIHETELVNMINSTVTATEISSYISVIKYKTILALYERPVSLISYDPHDSSRLLTVHQKENSKKDGFCLLCLWNIHQPWQPKLMLKSHGNVSCACFVYSDSSHIVAGHDDGSLCVWNLTERDAYSIEETTDYGELHFRIKLPSYNTAEVLKNTSHKSRVIQVDAVQTEKKSTSEQNPEMVYSIDENNNVITWTLSTSSSQMSDLGLAPWSKVKFFVNQTMNIAQSLPKNIFQTTAAKVLSEFDILLGTNAGFAVKFNLFNKKLKKYRRVYRSTESNDCGTKVTNLEVSPHNQLYFAIAYASGDVCLFQTRYTEPICQICNDNFNFTFTPVLFQWLWNKHNCIIILESHQKLRIFQFNSTKSTCISIHEEELKDRVQSMVVSPPLPNQMVLNFVFLTETEIQVHNVVSFINQESADQSLYLPK